MFDIIEKRVVLLKRMVSLLGIIGFFVMIYLHALNINYANDLPRSPLQSEGRIVKIIVNHGAIRYATEAEVSYFHCIGTIVRLLVILGLIGAMIIGGSRERSAN